MSSTGRFSTPPAGTPFGDLYARIPDYRKFHTLAEMRARTRHFQQLRPDLVSVETIGQSRRGEPIELITVGKGRRSALVLSAPHPNEPVGGLAVDFLIGQLLHDENLRAQLDYTWHFINPIDVDGTVLNEGWLHTPLEPRTYYRDFARPAMKHQPDYTFPIHDVAGHSFTESPSENAAWRVALDRIRPDFHYSLHNAEYGGVFYIVSRDAPAMEEALVKIPETFGVALSYVGEPPGESAPLKERPGISGMPRPQDMLKKAAAAGADPKEVWKGGGSSTEYADRYGSFSFVAEVPYWDDARIFDRSPSEWTRKRAYEEIVSRTNANWPLLEKWGEVYGNDERSEFIVRHALLEMLPQQRKAIAGLAKAAEMQPADAPPLSVSDALHIRIELRMFPIRAYAMLARLAREGARTAQNIEVEQAAQAVVDQELAAIEKDSALRPIPIRSLVGIEVVSGLVAATNL